MLHLSDTYTGPARQFLPALKGYRLEFHRRKWRRTRIKQ